MPCADGLVGFFSIADVLAFAVLYPVTIAASSWPHLSKALVRLAGSNWAVHALAGLKITSPADITAAPVAKLPPPSAASNSSAVHVAGSSSVARNLMFVFGSNSDLTQFEGTNSADNSQFNTVRGSISVSSAGAANASLLERKHEAGSDATGTTATESDRLERDFGPDSAQSTLRKPLTGVVPLDTSDEVYDQDEEGDRGFGAGPSGIGRGSAVQKLQSPLRPRSPRASSIPAKLSEAEEKQLLANFPADDGSITRKTSKMIDKSGVLSLLRQKSTGDVASANNTVRSQSTTTATSSGGDNRENSLSLSFSVTRSPSLEDYHSEEYEADETDDPLQIVESSEDVLRVDKASVQALAGAALNGSNSNSSPNDGQSSPRKNLHSVLPPQLSGVPVRNPFFVGRVSALAMLDKRLKTDTQLVVLGPEGIGKSALVAEYIHRHRQQFTHVFWVRSSSPGQIVKGFLDIALALNLVSAPAKFWDRLHASLDAGNNAVAAAAGRTPTNANRKALRARFPAALAAAQIVEKVQLWAKKQRGCLFVLDDALHADDLAG